jgi:hypothetical protein
MLNTTSKYDSEYESMPSLSPNVPDNGIIDVNFYPVSGNFLTVNGKTRIDVMTQTYIDAVYSTAQRPYSELFCGTRDTLFGGKGDQYLVKDTLLDRLNKLYNINNTTMDATDFNNYFNNGPPEKGSMFVYYFNSDKVGRVIRDDISRITL